MLNSRFQHLLRRTVPVCLPRQNYATKQSEYEIDPKTLFTTTKLFNQTEKDIGLMYVPDKSLASHTLAGVNKSVQSHFDVSKEISFVTRQHNVDILQKVRSGIESGEQVKMLLHGPKGVGKSFTMSQVVQACAETKSMFILYIPAALWLTQHKEKISASRWTSDRLDQNIHAGQLLSHLEYMNGPMLKLMKTTQDYTLGEDFYPTGTPLLTMMEKNNMDVDYSTLEDDPFSADCYAIVLKELMAQKDFHVLFAIDEFNGLYNRTTLVDFYENIIHPRHLSVVRALRKVWESENPKIVKVCATTSSGVHSKYPVGLEVSAMIDKFGYGLTNYSRLELEGLLDYYKYRLVTTFGSNHIHQVSLLSALNPYHVHAVCKKC